MDLSKVNVGEALIIQWQYKMLGDFFIALIEAIARADIQNMAKLRKGFPELVDAYQCYTNIDGWWEELQKKVGIS